MMGTKGPARSSKVTLEDIRTFRHHPVPKADQPARPKETPVIVLGIVLLLIGFIAKIPILWGIGIVVLVIGLILLILGAMGRAVGGRKHYY
jgi:hypothetical protein